MLNIKESHDITITVNNANPNLLLGLLMWIFSG